MNMTPGVLHIDHQVELVRAQVVMQLLAINSNNHTQLQSKCMGLGALEHASGCSGTCMGLGALEHAWVWVLWNMYGSGCSGTCTCNCTEKTTFVMLIKYSMF